MPFLSASSYFGLAPETVYGTAVAATTWMWVEDPSPENKIDWIENEGHQGTPAAVVGAYQGVQSSTYSHKGMTFPISVGHLFKAAFGVDTVSGASNPYTHTFSLAAGQPPSYTLSDFDGVKLRQYPGSILESLEFDFAAKAALKFTAKWAGLLEVDGTTIAPTSETGNPFLNWQATATFGANPANTNVSAGSLTIKRTSVEPIITIRNTQAPKMQFAGQFDISGKLTIICEDDTEFLYFKNGTVQALSLLLAQPSVGPTLKFQMSKAYIKEASRKRGKKNLEVDLSFRAQANATDAGASGPISPGRVVLTNSQTTAY